MIWYVYPLWNGLCSLYPCLMLQQDKIRLPHPVLETLPSPRRGGLPLLGPGARSSMNWALHLPRLMSNPFQPHQHQIISNSPPTSCQALLLELCLCYSTWVTIAIILPLQWPPPLHDQLLVVPSHLAHISHFPTLLLSPTSKGQVGGPWLDFHSPGKAPLSKNVPHCIEIIHCYAFKWLEMSQK